MSGDDGLREWAALLFRDPAPLDPQPAPAPLQNVVPTEGTNPSPASGDQDLREFARELFHRTTDI